ncbi:MULTISPECIES: hypothetical protein [unclassified Hahella]|uniref:hypothetical protein n=1 Tax=unclassified Hahella TaxID=2624107 RepID=UPI001C1EC06E|nr:MULTISPECIES: hypothetical protein [unclassified Hahella]MBU6951344.1 hypothetical protein [Hahella sp. HN01]MDG9670615.1 hypothetical protein [Hahella sp. CR1]
MRYTGLVLALMVSTVAWSTEPSKVEANRAYSLSAPANLRDSPPSTFLYILGDKKGSVAKDDSVVVKEVKKINTLTGTQYWINVEQAQPGTASDRSGWVYIGKDGGESILMEERQ